RRTPVAILAVASTAAKRRSPSARGSYYSGRMAYDVKGNSSILLSGRDRAPARSFLKAIGYSDEDLQKPIVGIANTWTEPMPCNFNLRQLAARIKEGVRAAGGTPMEFNTVAVSDGITMGTEGMKASLVS